MQLESIYGHPGLLLLASTDDGERLGCVGLKQLADQPEVGEIRRLFVRPGGRKLGLGRQLVERLTTQAEANGLQRLVLNTVPAMTEAIALYGSLGFEPISPYVDEPLDDTLYFGRTINPENAKA